MNKIYFFKKREEKITDGGGWDREKEREGEKSRGTYSHCVVKRFPFLFDFYIAGLKAFE